MVLSSAFSTISGLGYRRLSDRSVRPTREFLVSTRGYGLTPCLRFISRENSVMKFSRVPQPSWPAMARPPSAKALLGPGFQAADNRPPPKAPP